VVIWVSQRFGDKKIGFNSCECIKFLNIANFHVFYVWGRRILSCNDNIFPSIFFLFLILQRNFFPLRLRHQTSASKLRYIRSSGIYRQPIEYIFFTVTCVEVRGWGGTVSYKANFASIWIERSSINSPLTWLLAEWLLLMLSSPYHNLLHT